jgi:hypothetical protein
MPKVIELSKRKYKVHYDGSYIIVEAKTWLHALEVAEKKLNILMKNLGKTELVKEV